MHIHTSTEPNGKQWIVLDGALDEKTRTLFRQTCAPFVQSSNAHLVLDMTAVNYVSNAGLEALLDLQTQLAAKGSSLAIFGLNIYLYRIFEIMGAAHSLHIFNAREQAMGFVGAQGGESCRKP